ncbi:hypothetical protein [Pedobacter insulae]|uniref:Uncharacterized protein n=1 Tax=Pedobacter insulae TaxID=414048 RepID=A0A1I2SZU4_9SPHI|nr:hypothetical protein [Pedobacter insulae]SFG56507.1 hypothetical protein SAMN04489864_10168 [Pedobacter insulae]
MTPVEIVYKTMFNHFVKKEGYSQSSHVIAGAATSLCNLLFLANCYFLVKIIFSNPIPISFTKVEGLITSGVLIIINHYLVFVVFRFSKNGDGPNQLFNITRKDFSLGWWIFGVNLLLALAIPLLESFISES